MGNTATLKAKLTFNDSLFTSGLKKAVNFATGIGRQIGTRLKSAITSPLMGVAAMIAGIFSYAVFKDGIKGAIDAGEALADFKSISGVAVANSSKLRDVWEQSGGELGEFSKAISIMQKGLVAAGKGQGGLRTELFQIGIKLSDIMKLSPEDQFVKIGKAINKIENPAKRVGAAMNIFGKGAKALLEQFSSFDDLNMPAMDARAKAFERSADMFDKTNAALRTARTSFSNFFLGIAAQVAPTIKGIAEDIANYDWLKTGDKIGAKLKKGLEVLRAINLGEAFAAIKERAGGAFDYAIVRAKQLINTFAAIKEFVIGSIIDISGTLGAVAKSVWAILSTFGGELRAIVTDTLKTIGGVMGVIFKLAVPVLAKIDKALEATVKGFATMFQVSFAKIMDDADRRMGQSGKNYPFDPDSLAGDLEKALARMRAGNDFGRSFVKSIKDAWDKDNPTQTQGKKKDWGKVQTSLIPKTGDIVGASLTPETDLRERTKQTSRGIEMPRGIEYSFGGGYQMAAATMVNRVSNPHALTNGIAGQKGERTVESRLSMRERMAFDNAAVAAGGERQGSRPGAFNAVRSGDAKRRKEAMAEQERGKLGIEKTNELLENQTSKLDQILQKFN